MASTHIQIWQTSLQASNAQAHALRQYLSPDEQARATRFIIPQHQRRFLVARASLRLLLAQQLGLDATEICFEYSEHGKPRLHRRQQPTQPLYFNLSHSQDWAIYALTQVGEVGIDLEQIRDDFPYLEVAKHQFSPREYQQLRELPAPQAKNIFFRYWTRKEALMKATGLGLALASEQFEVSIDSPHPILLPSFNNKLEKSNTWQLHNLDAPEGFMAALAVQGCASKLSQTNFSPIAPATVANQSNSKNLT